MDKKDLLKRLYLSDIIVLPYRITPSVIPLAFFDALMLNGPLVMSTSTPGINEHVRQYLHSRVLKPTYVVNELENVVTSIIENRRLYKVIIQKQHNYALQLCQEIIREQHEKYIMMY